MQSSPIKRCILLGKVSVDSGSLFIGDPCYLSDQSGVSRNPFKDWSAFCKSKDGKEYWKNNSPVNHVQIKEGVNFGTVHGDGTYDVYFVELENGTKLVEVVLNDGNSTAEGEW
jgi:hypothetical protein